MKSRSRFLIGVCLGALCGLAAGGVTIATGDDDDDARYTAEAEIFGPPGSDIRGEARFEQRSLDDQPTPVVEVDVWVRGLPPGPRTRAFHVHETGRCEPPTFAAAGGHFDAGPFRHTTPPDTNHPYHLGDLPELEVRGRTARMHGVTTRFVLQPDHATTIFGDEDGAAVIVHALEDRGEETPPGQPGFAGSAGGGRVACGVIEMEASDDDD
jgi:superoxide dismutase, Cu-Zn family